jgi:hypothetical protein
MKSWRRFAEAPFGQYKMNEFKETLTFNKSLLSPPPIHKKEKRFCFLSKIALNKLGASKEKRLWSLSEY